MTVQKYRKKPVEVEAMQWNGTAEGADEVIGWTLLNQARNARYQEADSGTTPAGTDWDDPGYIMIDTLEGRMSARPGDWIIRGVKGEFYPCKPDIFAATYEAVQAPVERGPWVRRGELPPIGAKLVAGNTGKVVYEVIEHDNEGWRRDRVRLRDTRTGKSAGWETAHYFRYLIEENNA